MDVSACRAQEDAGGGKQRVPSRNSSQLALTPRSAALSLAKQSQPCAKSDDARRLSFAEQAVWRVKPKPRCRRARCSGRRTGRAPTSTTGLDTSSNPRSSAPIPTWPSAAKRSSPRSFMCSRSKASTRRSQSTTPFPRVSRAASSPATSDPRRSGFRPWAPTAASQM